MKNKRRQRKVGSQAYDSSEERPTEHPSLQIILEVARGTWEIEDGRISAIDTKTGITLGLSGAFLVALLMADPAKCVRNIKMLLCWEQLGTSISEHIIALLLVVLLTLSCVLFLIVLRIASYTAVGISEPIEKGDFERLADDTALYYANLYIKIAKENQAISNRRIRLYKAGLILLCISLCLFIVFVFLVN